MARRTAVTRSEEFDSPLSPAPRVNPRCYGIVGIWRGRHVVSVRRVGFDSRRSRRGGEGCSAHRASVHPIPVGAGVHATVRPRGGSRLSTVRHLLAGVRWDPSRDRRATGDAGRALSPESRPSLRRPSMASVMGPPRVHRARSATSPPRRRFRLGARSAGEDPLHPRRPRWRPSRAPFSPSRQRASGSSKTHHAPSRAPDGRRYRPEA